MTSNGAIAPQTEAPEDLAPTEEHQPPNLNVTSLDYWRQMTQRQIERLQARIKELDDEAAPLRMQISVLSQALRAVDRGPGPKQYTQKRPRLSKVVSLEERTTIRSMVKAGKTNAEIIAALPPHLPSKPIKNMAYNDRVHLGLHQPEPRS